MAGYFFFAKYLTLAAVVLWILVRLSKNEHGYKTPPSREGMEYMLRNHGRVPAKPLWKAFFFVLAVPTTAGALIFWLLIIGRIGISAE